MGQASEDLDMEWADLERGVCDYCNGSGEGVADQVCPVCHGSGDASRNASIQHHEAPQ